MKLLFFIFLVFYSSIGVAFDFEELIERTQKEIKSTEFKEDVYPVNIYVVSKKSKDPIGRKVAEYFTDEELPYVIYEFIFKNERTIKLLQADGLGVIKKQMESGFEKNMYKNCSIKNSNENIITSNGYDLHYLYKSPEGWELLSVVIDKDKCMKLAK